MKTKLYKDTMCSEPIENYSVVEHKVQGKVERFQLLGNALNVKLEARF